MKEESILGHTDTLKSQYLTIADNLPESLFNPFDIISYQKVICAQSVGLLKPQNKLTTALSLIPYSVKHTVGNKLREAGPLETLDRQVGRGERKCLLHKY